MTATAPMKESVQTMGKRTATTRRMAYRQMSFPSGTVTAPRTFTKFKQLTTAQQEWIVERYGDRTKVQSWAAEKCLSWDIVRQENVIQWQAHDSNQWFSRDEKRVWLELHHVRACYGEWIGLWLANNTCLQQTSRDAIAGNVTRDVSPEEADMSCSSTTSSTVAKSTTTVVVDRFLESIRNWNLNITHAPSKHVYAAAHRRYIRAIHRFTDVVHRVWTKHHISLHGKQKAPQPLRETTMPSFAGYAYCASRELPDIAEVSTRVADDTIPELVANGLRGLRRDSGQTEALPEQKQHDNDDHKYDDEDHDRYLPKAPPAELLADHDLYYKSACDMGAVGAAHLVKSAAAQGAIMWYSFAERSEFGREHYKHWAKLVLDAARNVELMKQRVWGTTGRIKNSSNNNNNNNNNDSNADVDSSSMMGRKGYRMGGIRPHLVRNKATLERMKSVMDPFQVQESVRPEWLLARLDGMSIYSPLNRRVTSNVMFPIKTSKWCVLVPSTRPYQPVNFDCVVRVRPGSEQDVDHACPLPIPIHSKLSSSVVHPTLYYPDTYGTYLRPLSTRSETSKTTRTPLVEAGTVLMSLVASHLVCLDTASCQYCGSMVVKPPSYHTLDSCQAAANTFGTTSSSPELSLRLQRSCMAGCLGTLYCSQECMLCAQLYTHTCIRGQRDYIASLTFEIWRIKADNLSTSTSPSSFASHKRSANTRRREKKRMSNTALATRSEDKAKPTMKNASAEVSTDMAHSNALILQLLVGLIHVRVTGCRANAVWEDIYPWLRWMDTRFHVGVSVPFDTRVSMYNTLIKLLPPHYRELCIGLFTQDVYDRLLIACLRYSVETDYGSMLVPEVFHLRRAGVGNDERDTVANCKIVILGPQQKGALPRIRVEATRPLHAGDELILESQQRTMVATTVTTMLNHRYLTDTHTEIVQLRDTLLDKDSVLFPELPLDLVDLLRESAHNESVKDRDSKEARD